MLLRKQEPRTNSPLDSGFRRRTGEQETSVAFRLNGRERTIDIVGDDEADPTAGKIAFSALLAHALIGAGPDDLVDFGNEADAIEVVAAGPIPES